MSILPFLSESVENIAAFFYLSKLKSTIKEKVDRLISAVRNFNVYYKQIKK